MSESWLEKTINEIHAGIPDSAWAEVAYRQWLCEMYRAMDFLMRSGAWGTVNAYLGEMPAAPTERSIAVLRFLSNVDGRVPAWSTLLMRVNEHLVETGKDAPKMLRGLLS